MNDNERELRREQYIECCKRVDERDARIARLQAEVRAWREAKTLSVISLIDAPIIRAKSEVDAHHDLDTGGKK